MPMLAKQINFGSFALQHIVNDLILPFLARSHSQRTARDNCHSCHTCQLIRHWIPISKVLGYGLY